MSRVNMVRLRSSQTCVYSFKHPLLDDTIEQMDPDTERLVLEEFFSGSMDARDRLILNYLPLLRWIIGRYLYHWPVTRRFLDDMVSEGLVAIIAAISNYTPDKLGEMELLKTVANKIQYEIEKFISDNLGLVPAPFRENRKKVQNGRPPVFGLVEGDLDDVKDFVVGDDPNLIEVDVLDVIAVMRNESELKTQLLDRELWSMSNQEIADKLGISIKTVRRQRNALLQEYTEKAGDINVD